MVAATTTIFTFRNNTSEQYQRNTDIIPKLFRHCSESEYSLYSLCFRRLFRLPTSKSNQNSLKIRFFSTKVNFDFQVLILRTWSLKWSGLGRGDPPQNQWVKMDHWFSCGTIPKKVVGIVPNIVPIALLCSSELSSGSRMYRVYVSPHFDPVYDHPWQAKCNERCWSGPPIQFEI